MERPVDMTKTRASSTFLRNCPCRRRTKGFHLAKNQQLCCILTKLNTIFTTFGHRRDRVFFLKLSLDRLLIENDCKARRKHGEFNTDEKVLVSGCKRAFPTKLACDCDEILLGGALPILRWNSKWERASSLMLSCFIWLGNGSFLISFWNNSISVC